MRDTLAAKNQGPFFRQAMYIITMSYSDILLHSRQVLPRRNFFVRFLAANHAHRRGEAFHKPGFVSAVKARLVSFAVGLFEQLRPKTLRRLHPKKPRPIQCFRNRHVNFRAVASHPCRNRGLSDGILSRHHRHCRAALIRTREHAQNDCFRHKRPRRVMHQYQAVIRSAAQTLAYGILPLSAALHDPPHLAKRRAEFSGPREIIPICGDQNLINRRTIIKNFYRCFQNRFPSRADFDKLLGQLQSHAAALSCRRNHSGHLFIPIHTLLLTSTCRKSCGPRRSAARWSH